MDDYNRRQFIRTSIPGFLGLSLALPGITALATRANACQGRVRADGAVNWDAFLEAVAEEAAKQHLDQWSEAAYVKQVAALVARLNLQDPALAAAFEATKNGLGNGRVDFSKLERVQDFEVCLVQFEEGEAIQHHDHPSMTGVLLCATGETDVWNYDLLGERKERPEVLLKENVARTAHQGPGLNPDLEGAQHPPAQGPAIDAVGGHLHPSLQRGARGTEFLVRRRSGAVRRRREDLRGGEALREVGRARLRVCS